MTASLQPPHFVATDDVSAEAIKFGLFLKTHEMKQIGEALKPILLMNKKERQGWVKENEIFINDMLENFMEDATGALDGLQLDQETMKLSMNFVIELRTVMNKLQGILYDRRNLIS